MLGELLGIGGSILGGILNNNAANSRMKKMLRHIREVMAWQRQNLATAQTELRAGRAEYENDPRRAKLGQAWQDLLDNPSALTPEIVSSIKQNAITSTAKQASETQRRTAANVQRRGLGNSPIGAILDASISRGASQDVQNLVAGIDKDAALQRRKDEMQVLSGYTDWTTSDMDRRYQFSKDIAGLLGSVNYGNSAALTGV